MKAVKLTVEMMVEEEGIEPMKKAADHVLESLIDFDSWPEIKTYSAKFEVDDATILTANKAN